MKYIRTLVASLAVILSLVSFVPQTVGAINLFGEACKSSNSEVCNEAKDGKGATSKLVQTVISTLLFVIGVIAVIMIIVGGIRYITSDGDSSKITSAKNTIMYSVVGLVVSLLAYVIVDFVIDQF